MLIILDLFTAAGAIVWFNGFCPSGILFMSCIILLAEDDVVVRNSARLLPQAEGHDVLVATDGHEALKLSREYQGAIEMLVTAG